MRFFVQWISLALFAVAMLGGCGGSDSPATSTATGVFADAPVQGVRYVFGNYSGFTGSGGTFSYPVGTRGTFRVGDIVIGTATGSPLITVIDLVKARHPEYTDEQARSAALKIVRFLTSIGGGHLQQLLDIPQEVFYAAQGGNFRLVDLLALSDKDLEVLVERLGPFQLATSEEARTHLENTLKNASLLPHVGTYMAEDWDGNAIIEVFVHPDGTLFGSGTNAKGDIIDLWGKLDSSGAVSFETRYFMSYNYPKKTVAKAAPGRTSVSTGTSDGKGSIVGTVLEKGTFSGRTFPFSLRRIANPMDGYAGLYRGWFYDEYEVANFAFGVGTSGKIVGWAGDSTGVTPLSGKIDPLTGEFILPCGNGVVAGALSGQGVDGIYSGTPDVKLEVKGQRIYMGDPR